MEEEPINKETKINQKTCTRSDFKSQFSRKVQDFIVVNTIWTGRNETRDKITTWGFKDQENS